MRKIYWAQRVDKKEKKKSRRKGERGKDSDWTCLLRLVDLMGDSRRSWSRKKDQGEKERALIASSPRRSVDREAAEKRRETPRKKEGEEGELARFYLLSSIIKPCRAASRKREEGRADTVTSFSFSSNRRALAPTREGEKAEGRGGIGSPRLSPLIFTICAARMGKRGDAKKGKGEAGPLSSTLRSLPYDNFTLFGLRERGERTGKGESAAC